MRRIAAVGGRGLLLVFLAVGAARGGEASPATEPAEGAGRLSIVSQPGVEVVWEGISLGETDESGLLMIEGIPPGSYELVLQKPEHRARASQVEIGPGRQSVRLELGRVAEPRAAEAKPVEARPPVPQAPVSKSPSETAVLPKEPWPGEPEPRVPLPDPAGVPPLTGEGAALGAVEPGPGPAPGPTAGGLTTTPLLADPSQVAPPAMGPVPAATRAGERTAAGAEEDPRPAPQEGGLPPVVYLLGLGLLTATGAVAFRRHQQARARAELLAHPVQLAFQRPREVEGEPPEFLDDLQRREQRIDDVGGRAHADAIDVEVEVIDLGPVEDAD